jgi:hypothetical protein
MRRAKWGIGAVLVVGFAWFLSNFFNIRLGGIGTDEGSQIGLPTQTTVADSDRDETPSEPPAQTEPLPESDDQSVSLQDTSNAIGAGGAIDVLIDGRMFFIRRGAGEHATWVPAEPAVIASYAQQAEGDETGVRVRIFRRPSALASAEKDLSDSLHSAGIPASQIDLREQLLEKE